MGPGKKIWDDMVCLYLYYYYGAVECQFLMLGVFNEVRQSWRALEDFCEGSGTAAAVPRRQETCPTFFLQVPVKLLYFQRHLSWM